MKTLRLSRFEIQLNILAKVLVLMVVLVGVTLVCSSEVQSSPAATQGSYNLPCSMTAFNQNSYSGYLNGCGLTFDAGGCAVTSAAMVFDYYGVRTNPQMLSDCMGTKDCDFWWNWAADNCDNGKVSGQETFDASYATIKNHLSGGRPVILKLYNPTPPSGYPTNHFVVVYRAQDPANSPSDFWIIDPEGGVEKNLNDWISAGWSMKETHVYYGTPWCQQDGGPCPQAGGVILYKHWNYDCNDEGEGYGYIMPAGFTGRQDVPSGFNDQASSIKIPWGYSVRLYEYYTADPGGGSICLNSDTLDFYDMVFDNGIGLGDKVSSLEVFPNTSCTGGFGYPVTLYQDSWYHGPSVSAQGQSWSNVPDWFNDKASSIKIDFGWSVRVYEHINLDTNGDSRCFVFSDPSLEDDLWENRISSFEVFSDMSCGGSWGGGPEEEEISWTVDYYDGDFNTVLIACSRTYEGDFLDLNWTEKPCLEMADNENWTARIRSNFSVDGAKFFHISHDDGASVCCSDSGGYVYWNWNSSGEAWTDSVALDPENKHLRLDYKQDLGSAHLSIRWQDEDPDSTGPEVQVVQPSNGESFYADGACPLVFQAQASDEGSGVEYVEMYLEDNGEWFSLGRDYDEPYFWQSHVCNSTDDHFWVKAYAEDSRGNGSWSENIAFTIDRNVWTARFHNGPEPNDLYDVACVKHYDSEFLDLTWDENPCPGDITVDNWSVALDRDLGLEGSYYWYAQHTGGASICCAPGPSYIYWNYWGSNPGGSWTDAVYFPGDDPVKHIAYRATGSGGDHLEVRWQAEEPIPPTGWTVDYYDGDFNTVPVACTKTYDGEWFNLTWIEKPCPSMADNEGWTARIRSNFEVEGEQHFYLYHENGGTNLCCSDTGGYVYWNWDSPGGGWTGKTALEPDNKRLRLDYQQFSSPSSLVVRWQPELPDLTLPTLTSPNEGSYFNLDDCPLSFTFHASDDESGMDKVTLWMFYDGQWHGQGSIEGDGPYQWQWSEYGTIEERQAYLYAEARDNAGNIKSLGFNVFFYKGVQPEWEITSPVNMATIYRDQCPVTVQAVVSDTDNDLLFAELWVTQSQPPFTRLFTERKYGDAGQFEWNWDCSDETEPSVLLSIYAEDKEGNGSFIASSTTVYLEDSAKPTWPTPKNPAYNGQWLENPIAIEWYAVLEADEYYAYLVPVGDGPGYFTGWTTQTSWSLGSLPPGEYLLGIKSRNQWGESEFVTVTFVVPRKTYLPLVLR